MRFSYLKNQNPTETSGIDVYLLFTLQKTHKYIIKFGTVCGIAKYNESSPNAEYMDVTKQMKSFHKR
jgi:hypothetical protein